MDNNTVTCPQCGSSSPAGARFCSNCGHVLSSADADYQVANFMTADQPEVEPRDTAAASIAQASIGSAPEEDMPGLSSPASPEADAMLAGETSQDAQSPDTDEWHRSLAASPGEKRDLADEEDTRASGGVTMFAPPPPVDTPAPPMTWQPGEYGSSSEEQPQQGPDQQAVGAATVRIEQSATQPPYTPPPSQQGPAPTQPFYSPPPQYNPGGLQGGAQPGGQPPAASPAYPAYPNYPPPTGYPAQVGAAGKDPTIALLLELLGYIGFLGIGHMYAGKIGRGIGLLIGGWFYLMMSVILLIFIIGCFMFMAWLVIPIASGFWIKTEMERERAAQMRP